MRKIAIAKLSSPVRSFLAEVRRARGVVIEDEQGRDLFRVIPYAEASKGQQAAALRRLKQIQVRVGKMMRRTGKTEAEFDRIVQKD